MRVVGGGNHDGISRLQHLIVHLAIVVILPGIRVFVKDMLGILPVAITQTDDVICLGHFCDIRCATTANANAQDIQFIARSFLSDCGTKNTTWHNVRCYNQASKRGRSLL